MTKKQKNKKIRWQPELATSIIYWSTTFSFLFLSIISLLEVNGFNWFFVLFLFIFLVLAYFGQRRFFKIENESLIIVAVFKKNSYTIPLVDIEKVKIGAYGLTLFGGNLPIVKEENRSFLMTDKSKALLAEALQATPAFSGEVVSIKKKCWWLTNTFLFISHQLP